MDGRAGAAVAARAVQDDARQDEGHAGDPDHVREVLEGEARMRFMAAMASQRDVDDDVQHATGGHHEKANQHERRQSPQPPSGLYHQHELEIHPHGWPVNSIANGHV